jgi:hypothetical protein
MKKLYFAAASLIAMSMMACDPAVEEIDNHPIQLTDAQLDSRVIVTQEGTSDVFTFTTSPSTYVQIRHADDNSLLASGMAGKFQVPVFSQGNLKVQTLNTNGNMIETSKSFRVESWEVTDVLKTILGNNFETDKQWTWDTGINADGGCWGNAGYQAGAFDGNSINGQWWGCPNDGFSGQLQHSNTGKLTGEEEAGAYLVFNKNQVLKYDAKGNLLNTGSFSVDGKANNIGSEFGYLNTSEGAILWPFMINGGGYMPTSFEIAYLTDKKLQLVYAKEGTGSWGECTWWAFKAKE